ncbi:hypothetical protein Q3G72_010654 [Acer saccharum]|nr:hypothetical protein Q3G72_010654 [Acer saccharum]
MPLDLSRNIATSAGLHQGGHRVKLGISLLTNLKRPLDTQYSRVVEKYSNFLRYCREKDKFSSNQIQHDTTPLATTKDSGGIAARTVVIIVVVSVIMFVVLVALAYFILRRQKQKQIRSNQERRYYADEIDAEEALQFDFSTIKVATNDFSINGKLGQGGFGAVYKGRLSNGQDIAVKRLSNNSGQGEAEFKNEVIQIESWGPLGIWLRSI